MVLFSYHKKINNININFQDITNAVLLNVKVKEVFLPRKIDLNHFERHYSLHANFNCNYKPNLTQSSYRTFLPCDLLFFKQYLKF